MYFHNLPLEKGRGPSLEQSRSIHVSYQASVQLPHQTTKIPWSTINFLPVKLDRGQYGFLVSITYEYFYFLPLKTPNVYKYSVINSFAFTCDFMKLKKLSTEGEFIE